MPAGVLSPKDRRAVLQQLSRDRLAELTARFELDVDDRRSTDSHVGAIVRKRSLDFRRVLEALRREELQAACEALGLDFGGREGPAEAGGQVADPEELPSVALAQCPPNGPSTTGNPSGSDRGNNPPGDGQVAGTPPGAGWLSSMAGSGWAPP